MVDKIANNHAIKNSYNSVRLGLLPFKYRYKIGPIFYVYTNINLPNRKPVLLYAKITRSEVKLGWSYGRTPKPIIPSAERN